MRKRTKQETAEVNSNQLNSQTLRQSHFKTTGQFPKKLLLPLHFSLLPFQVPLC